MIESLQKPHNYLYKYSYHEDELELCQLEMRSFYGFDSSSNTIHTKIEIDPNRSPFIKWRIAVLYEGNTIEDIENKVDALKLEDVTFKVTFIKNEDRLPFEKRREIERNLGLKIEGKVDLHHPEIEFAITKVNDKCFFGYYAISESKWFKHQQKPHNYSTALSTRVARAVVNIAVPNPDKVKVIDPCCGIGTVLIEALSMGIDIVGSDVNPLVLPGTRENIAYFGFSTEITLKDIRNVEGQYDVAIIDMPYNLCSVLDEKEQLEMLQSARKFTKKLVIVTIETIDSIIIEAGFTIIDRCLAKKSRFTRQVIVCR